MTVTFPSRSELAAVVTGRSTPLLDHDLQIHAQAVDAAVRGRRVLVLGGAGSIGAATIRQLMAFGPQQVQAIDLDENSLVELLRDLRSDDAVPTGSELRVTPLDLAAPIMRRLLHAEDPYDLVLNFAAVKHVRSERDVFSLLRMLETNVLAADRLMSWVSERGAPAYFAVSTDKAANPVNIMGATKRAMELMMFDQRRPVAVTSARFANVAFSNGSLLDGWLRRLEKGQPWAVPASTRRYFVSPEESGQLCLLAATAAPDRHVVVPALSPELHLRDLVEVADEVLGALGLQPVHCTSEGEARSAMRRVRGTTQWPVLITSLDTAGEKEFEEFSASDDVAHGGRFEQLTALRTPFAEPLELDAFLARATHLVNTDEAVSSHDIIDCVRSIVGNLTHRTSDLSLDTRM